MESAQRNVPLPSHSDPEMFTTGAFGNFDHEGCTLSGIGGSHHTVSVLFQDLSPKCCSKPNISQTAVVYGTKVIKQNLSCQTLQDYLKPASYQLPEDFILPEDLYSVENIYNTIKKRDAAVLPGPWDGWIYQKLKKSPSNPHVGDSQCLLGVHSILMYMKKQYHRKLLDLFH